MNPTRERLVELNSLTKYPKIYTLFDRDNKFKLIKGTYNKTLKGIRNIKSFISTEKIDGTNCGIVLTPEKEIYIRKRSTIIKNNKEHKIYFDATKDVDTEKIKDYFKDSKSLVTIFGEACGGNIQKKGKVYSEIPTFRLFDIKCGNSFFDWKSVLEFSKFTGIKTVKWEHTKDLFREGSILGYDDLLKYLQDKNRKKYFEGIVVRSEPALLNNFGARMLFKVKLKDFEVK